MDVSKIDVCAKLEIESWHIPRPTLTPASSSLTSLGSSSTNSTHSARSGSLLLTAANIALIHQASQESKQPPTNQKQESNKITDNLQYYIDQQSNATIKSGILSVGDCRPTKDREKDPDCESIASSTHFTVVNVNSRPNVRKRSFCRKHQLTVLVVSMSILFLGGILAAILFMEIRARKQQF